MTSITFFILFIPILSIVLLGVNLLLAPHTPYQEKNSEFECGFHSFLGQNRTQFSISFFVFALLFLLFDLEILLVYPYSVSGNTNNIYGLVIMLFFFILLTLGFFFEIGKNALWIDSRQFLFSMFKDITKPHAFTSLPTQSIVVPYGLTSLSLKSFNNLYILNLVILFKPVLVKLYILFKPFVSSYSWRYILNYFLKII